MSTLVTNNVQLGSSGVSTNNFTIYQPATPDGTLRIGSGNTGTTSSLLALNSSGNLGLGVTPSAWTGSLKALQINARGALYASSTSTVLSDNVYNDGSAKYVQTAPAASYLIGEGSHQWFTAPSGTAGTAATFTQKMLLDNNGRLYVGQLRLGSVSQTPEGILDFNAESDRRWLARGGRLDCVNDANTGWQTAIIRANGIVFRASDDTEKLAVQNNGRVYLTNSASRGTTGYPVTTSNDSVASLLRATNYIEIQTDVGAVGVNYFLSDINKKQNITQSNFNSSELIADINFISFDWKPDSGNTGHVEVGVSAQQLQELDSRLVNELSDGSLMVNEPALVAHLAKAIQEQQTIIASLEARITALETAA